VPRNLSARIATEKHRRKKMNDYTKASSQALNISRSPDFFGTLAMGVYAKRPFAIAPYMGENAFVAYTVSRCRAIPGKPLWEPFL